MPPSAQADTALEADWLGLCRRATERVRKTLAAEAPGSDRLRVTGEVGEGGDETLLIDRAAEDAIFAELDALSEAGQRFTALSEERGLVDYGSEAVRVVIDPIDGSLNAKRGIPGYSVSIAVAGGPCMADVVFGFVHDLGAEEEFSAGRGMGATLVARDRAATGESAAGRRLDAADRGRGLELVAIEGAKPSRVAPAAAALEGAAFRLRAVGSIAIALCWLAAARVDGFVALMGCRSVDIAAAQLIALEAGAVLRWGGGREADAVPLDLEPRYSCIAARTEAAAEALAGAI